MASGALSIPKWVLAQDILSIYCSLSKQESNMNDMNDNYGEMGNSCKSLKIEETIAYAITSVLLN